MITFLLGVVEAVGADSVTLNVGGVGYEVFCAGRTLGKCPPGQEVRLLTHHHIREDQQTLFGFWDADERSLFRLLLGISGVGPKVALGILSALTPRDVADAILTQNGKMLAQAPGVGPKLGERIVLELKDKYGTLPGTAPTGGDVKVTQGVAMDVLSALVNMGFREVEAQRAVAATLQKQPDMPFDTALKKSLQGLR
jgi:Holliday junction DNA helicase RuvA